jgi:transcriptional regulator with XRE-family HTH domain
MPGNPQLSAATHFGRQLRKTRLARGWSLDDLAQATGINPGHLSRVENGRRPPTERLALLADAAFPERQGWFSDWYQESKTWSEVPAAFKDWGEYEDNAPTLLVWQPSIIDGLLQTEDYARALLATLPGATDETVAQRVATRMERQQRVLFRDEPPDALFLLDEVALYRVVGSADVMAGQMRHLLTVAALPNVTLQSVPLVAHAANASNLIIAGDAAYCEMLAGGYVFTDPQRVESLARRFDTLRSDSHRKTETVKVIEEMFESWTTGERVPVRTLTAGHASRLGPSRTA